MIGGVVVKLIVGAVCIVLGAVLWIKKALSVLHSYNYKNVKQEDVPAYCRLMGIGLILVGVGICVSGVLDLVCPSLWWIPFAAGFVLGLTVIVIAQKKYNGSIVG